MPDPLPLTGLYGKVPAHGDFVRRGLPSSFVGPWDAWLQSGIAQAREGMGAHWLAAWDTAPAWRFALPAGACGPDAVAGVMLPSEDQVGRRFPITLAVLLPPGDAPPDPAWFDAVEAAAWAGRMGQADADALAAAMPLPGAPLPEASAFAVPPPRPPPAAAPAPEPPAVTVATMPEAAPAAGSSVPTDDVLALLAGGTSDAPADTAAPLSDVLALLGGGDPPAAAQETPGPPGFTAAPDTDGTLAMLIGAGNAGPALAGTDPLAALLDAGTAPEADVLPAATAAMEWPEAAADEVPAAVAPLPEAPLPPEGGGWWTRGGAHVPPMVWPFAALPPAEDFAYLLEAEA